MEIGRLVEQEAAIPATLPEFQVAERLATYNLLAVPVCDDAERAPTSERPTLNATIGLPISTARRASARNRSTLRRPSR